jgi:hypothetical protein
MNRTIVNVQTGEQTLVPYTEEEMAEYNAKKAEQEAAVAAKAQLQAAYDTAAAVFSSLSVGKQALWEPVRQAVGKAILAGDMATAKEILETVPALYPDAETDRALFLSLFP